MTANARTRDPSRIEADLDRTRARMGDTLDKLEHKLSPGELFNQAVDYMRSRSNSEFAPNFKQVVTRNPLPVTLVGLGLAWLMMSGRRGSIPREHPSRTQGYEQDQGGAMPFDLQADARGEFSGSTRSDQMEGLETASRTPERAGLAAYSGGKAWVSSFRDEAATRVDEANPTQSDKADPVAYGGESSSLGRSDEAAKGFDEASPTATQSGSTTSGARNRI